MRQLLASCVVMLVVGWIAVTCARSVTAQEYEPLPANLIVVGDSQSSPFYDNTEPRGQGWVEFVEQQTGIQIANLAKSGSTSTDWLYYQFNEMHCQGAPIAYVWGEVARGEKKPCWALILLGTNDSKFSNLPYTTVYSLINIAHYLRTDAGVDRVFVMIPGDWFGFPWLRDRKAQIAASIDEECHQVRRIFECGPDMREIPHEMHAYIPQFDIHTAHPTIAGHAYIGQLVVDFLNTVEGPPPGTNEPLWKSQQ